MAPPKGDLSASMAILALLIRRPDTPSRVRVRLAEEFPHGRWSRSIAYNDVPNLAKQGLIRKTQGGKKKSEDLYEATPEGIATFKEWLSETAGALPPVRDALLLWLEHSEEAELPELIRVVCEAEDAARAEFVGAQVRLNTERALGNLGPADGADWHGQIRYTVLSELMQMCGERAMRLKRLRKKLQGQGRELQTEAPAGGDG
jgi:DNA-binding PadR family transcriptional regulator